MLPLQSAAALDDLQRYVAKTEEERGFSNRDVMQRCLLLGEEVGELFKAVRKHEKIRRRHYVPPTRQSPTVSVRTHADNSAITA